VRVLDSDVERADGDDGCADGAMIAHGTFMRHTDNDERAAYGQKHQPDQQVEQRAARSSKPLQRSGCVEKGEGLNVERVVEGIEQQRT